MQHTRHFISVLCVLVLFWVTKQFWDKTRHVSSFWKVRHRPRRPVHGKKENNRTETMTTTTTTTMKTMPVMSGSFGLVQIPVPRVPNPSTTLQIFPHNLSRTAYLLTSTEPLTLVMPQYHPLNKKPIFQLERVSRQARQHDCLWATNAGPFHSDASPAGTLILNGTLVSSDFGGAPAAGFGVTRIKNPEKIKDPPLPPQSPQQWVVGPLTSAEEAAQLSLMDYVTGFDWLVYQGRAVAGNRDGEFTPPVKRAPRTAVGVDKAGNLLLLVADGCERCLKRQGPTLKETADFLVRVGAIYAVNMDGGSSSTLVKQDKVINRPTCLDVTSISCSRPVGSVMCVSRNKTTVQ